MRWYNIFGFLIGMFGFILALIENQLFFAIWIGTLSFVVLLFEFREPISLIGWTIMDNKNNLKGGENENEQERTV